MWGLGSLRVGFRSLEFGVGAESKSCKQQAAPLGFGSFGFRFLVAV